jgi:hypothetical protein
MLSVCPWVCLQLSIYPSVCPCISCPSMSVHLSNCPSICLPMYPSVHPSVCLRTYPTVHLSTHLSFFQFVCLSVCLPFSAWLLHVLARRLANTVQERLHAILYKKNCCICQFISFCGVFCCSRVKRSWKDVPLSLLGREPLLK